MNHSEMTELLSAYVNDEVSQTQREFVETHLETCTTCQDELAEFRTVRRQLVSLREFSEPQESGVVTMATIRTERMDRRPGFRFPRPVLAAGFALTIAVALVVTLLTMNNGDGGSGGGIARAYDVFAELDSYRMSGTTEATIGGQMQSVEFDWSFSGAGSARGTVASADGGAEFILHDGVQYSRLTSGQGGAFGIIENSILSPVPTRDGTLEHLRSLLNVNELGDAQVNGIAVQRYSGQVDLDAFFDGLLAQAEVGSDEYESMAQFLEIQRHSEINIELWIGKEDGRLRRMVIDGTLVSASSLNGEIVEGPATTYMTVADYSGFNEQSQIEPPVGPDGSLQPGWSALGSTGGGPAPEVQLERISELK